MRLRICAKYQTSYKFAQLVSLLWLYVLRHLTSCSRLSEVEIPSKRLYMISPCWQRRSTYDTVRISVALHSWTMHGFRGSTILTTFFKLMRGERIQIPLKVGHYWPWCFAGAPMMAFCWWSDDGPIFNIECSLGSFVICSGSGPVLLGKQYSIAGFFRVGWGIP